ncbi:MAG: tRNA (N(6)-L-threonylcarbamoyladenosine(37)-C(2))-methylthiotransferase MtaB [Candidatus Neomarinimicrobiota bacterium]
MSTPTKRIAFHTMGCKLNLSETGTISRDFIQHGFQKVSYKEKADIYVLNTCSVTENANKEARKLIRQAKRRNPDSSIAIIGCYAQLKPNEISEIKGVDLVLGAKEKFNLLSHLEKLDIKDKTKIVESDIREINNFKSSYSSAERTRSFLKIQDGCNYTCSFCTIPLARGKSRSDSIKNTMETAKKITNRGAREIVLTGVNIGDFGHGTTETFYDLIQQLDTINELDRIRISSIEPNLLSTQIIDFCATSKKIMPHFHIPLQSGSNKILQSMRRRYNRELYEEKIIKIKNLIPDACIGVDVIVGFPGETDSEFFKTYDYLKELDISYLHVFSYSERENTEAIKIKDVVNFEERAERSKMLHILSNKKTHLFNDKFLNSNRPVLFESIKNGKVTGHTDNYIQVQVDGDSKLINKILPVNLELNCGSNIFGTLK